MRLRCRRRSSHDRELIVLAEGAAVGRHHRLAPRVAVGGFDAKPPEYFTAPTAEQDGEGAPQFSPVDVDGLGAASGDRSTGPVQWALKQQGRTDYYFWCLRFVANAFGAQYAGYNTAQIAAHALGTRGRGLPAAKAPYGALVFFRYVGRDGVSYGHVGISLGDGRMVHAVETVRVDHIDSSSYWRSNYLGLGLGAGSLARQGGLQAARLLPTKGGQAARDDEDHPDENDPGENDPAGAVPVGHARQGRICAGTLRLRVESLPLHGDHLQELLERVAHDQVPGERR